MSGYQDFSGGWKSGRLPEKSNFAMTCNRLSQYLKGKGNPRDLSLEIAGKLESKGRAETFQSSSENERNLLPNPVVEKAGEAVAHYRLMDLFPHHGGPGGATTVESDAPYKASSSKAPMEPKTAQMTIFYGGRVMVFDNFPTDKISDLILLAAGQTSPQNSGGFPSSSGADHAAASTLADPPQPGTYPALEQLQSEAGNSDVPIARRSSLHRFFEKRKDRVTARAPYQVHGGPSTSPTLKETLDLNF